MTTDNKKYNIDDYLKDALQQKHDSKPDRMIRLELEDGTVVIGKNRYDALKKIPQDKLLKTQKEQIEVFEKHHGIAEYTKAIIEKSKESENRLLEIEKRKQEAINNINKETVKTVFKKTYRDVNNVDFVANEYTVNNVMPLILYFAKDNGFLKYGVKNENGEFLSQPSLDKGLCIVGGFGNGKTSIMHTFQKMFIGLEGFSFGRYSSHEIVKIYEDAVKHNSPEVLENFWRLLTKGELYIDDVKAEPEALAYGKKNLLNTLFQDRYNKNLKTHITINYASGHNDNVMEALLEFKTKYSNQVYDRIYEMYNIIEFKGKSFRR